MNYEKLANEFLNATFELNKKGPQKTVDQSMQGESFVLYYLYEIESKALPSTISDKMGISTARVAVILNRLENKELITRTIDKSDRRRILVELTNKGINVSKTLHNKLREMVVNLLTILGEEDSKEFVRIIKKLSDISHLIEIPKISDY